VIRFGRLVVLVREYEPAIDFYVGALGLQVATDIEAGARRYVHLAVPDQDPVGVWLLKAETEADVAAVGRQAGDEPLGVFYTDDIGSAFQRLDAAGVVFEGPPTEGDGAWFAHFGDLYGNRFVLVQLATG
jgi:predicted enzyme related to lactoylglutathione lyase